MLYPSLQAGGSSSVTSVLQPHCSCRCCCDWVGQSITKACRCALQARLSPW